MRNLSKIDLKRVFIAFVALLVVVPVLTFASHSKKIYVDDSATGDQDGSSSHPYKTINQALRRANSSTEVHVANGTYKENLEVPNGVEIFGQNRDKTIIEAKNGDKSTVYLKGSAKLDDLTIKKGKNGIKVDNGGRVKILSCNVSKNDNDGIFISAKADLKEKDQVMISEVNASDNGRNGIYSEKRNVIIYKSTLQRNKSNGAVFAAGFKAWIGSTEFKDNYASGMVVTLDGTQLYTKNNSYSNNNREGIEVNAYGAAGRIDIAKSKIRNNDNYGIARVERKAVNNNIWKGLTVETTSYLLTHKGEISPIFSILN